MKEIPILITAIVLTIVVEITLITLITLIYNEVGGERIPSQIGRLIFQLILIFLAFKISFYFF